MQELRSHHYYSIKADGQDQSAGGNPHYDPISSKVVDDRTIEETQKKGGKAISTSKTAVSSDGSTATFEFTGNSSHQL